MGDKMFVIFTRAIAYAETVILGSITLSFFSFSRYIYISVPLYNDPFMAFGAKATENREDFM